MALPITGPASRLHDLEEIVATVGDRPEYHDEIMDADRRVDAEIAAVAGFGSRVELVVGAAAHHDLVLEALRNAQDQVVLACPWVGQLGSNEPLRAALASAASRGVSVHLLWGVTKRERREDTFKGDSWEFLSKFAPGREPGC